MWASVNHAMSVVFAAYLLPFAGLPAWLQLFAIALPGAVASLLVLRVTSDQPAITRTKNRITANLLALRLFGDDLRVVVRCQLSVLGRSVAYLRYALLPAAVMVVPFSLLVAQVESHYALRGLAPGEAAVLTVTLEDPEAPNNAAVQLRLGPGLVVETPALHVVREASVLWRIRATRAGEHRIVIQAPGGTVERRIVAGPPKKALSRWSFRGNDPRALAYPNEPPLSVGSVVREVHFAYPQARATFLGLSSASWLLAGFVLALAYLLRGWFRVTF